MLDNRTPTSELTLDQLERDWASENTSGMVKFVSELAEKYHTLMGREREGAFAQHLIELESTKSLAPVDKVTRGLEPLYRHVRAYTSKVEELYHKNRSLLLDDSDPFPEMALNMDRVSGVFEDCKADLANLNLAI
ncbi:hypothetical protein LTS14_002307 [Recurvomyces mirabilis]|nr:hypothetical protein LTS14_002307 [Recurvomyces mirabilis]